MSLRRLLLGTIGSVVAARLRVRAEANLANAEKLLREASRLQAIAVRIETVLDVPIVWDDGSPVGSAADFDDGYDEPKQH